MRKIYRLKDLRHDADLTQAQIAKIMHMHTNQYQRYENQSSDLPLQLAIQFAKFYHVSLEYLAGLTPKKEPEKTYIETPEKVAKQYENAKENIKQLISYILKNI